MAELTAKFIADFSSFYSAVDKATAKLDGFQKDADKVGGSLNKMVESLSGKKLISEATLMAKAVSEIGGASNLTEKELKKVSATVNEAAEKMSKLGIAVPQSFKDIQQAAQDVDKPTQGWGATLTSVTSIVRGFMGLQIVGFLKDAAAASFEWASGLVQLRAKTDLSLGDLQVLENVSIETGVGIESLAKSVQILQQRIGDRTAREGIQKLGLSFDAILAMKPADQLTAVASALAKIPDPTDRARMAALIFGNTWRDVMPALRANLAEIAASTTKVGDAGIEAADRLASKWDRYWADQKKGWSAWVETIVDAHEKGTKQIEAEQDAHNARMILQMGGGLPSVGAPAAVPGRFGAGPTVQSFVDPAIISDLQVYGLTLQQTAGHTKALADADKAAAEQAAHWDAVLERNRLATYNLGQSAVAASQNVAGFQIRMADTVGINKDYSKTLTAATIHTDSFGNVIKTDVLPSLKGLGQGMIDASSGTKTFGTNVNEYFSKGFGQNVAAAIAGGGNPVKAALTGLGQAVTGPDSGFAKTITKGVTGIFGETGMAGKIASTIGSMVPVIGSFIGPALEGLTALGKKLFGKSEETKSVSPIRDEFFKLQGGLETLNPRVEQLTGNLELVQAVLDAKTVDAYNAAIGKLNDLFAQEQQAIAAVDETAKRYGITIEELGPAMQRQQLDKQAQQLYKDWTVLNAAGIQTTVITTRMAESINKYTNDARKMGAEVPEAMRPMLQSMVDMGQLTDADGNKIESLESSGISFAMTMSEGFKSLIASVDKLATVLMGSLGTAVDSTTKKIKGIPNVVPVEIRYTEKNAPQKGGGDIPGYATGTGGKFVDFGAGTLAMLHGREAIVPEGATMRGSNGGGGGALGGGVTININAQGALFDTPGDLQRLADRVNEALTAKYGLSNRNRAA